MSDLADKKKIKEYLPLVGAGANSRSLHFCGICSCKIIVGYFNDHDCIPSSRIVISERK